MRLAPVRRTAVALAACFVCSCGGAGAPAAGDDGAAFVAVTGDFRGYHAWRSFDVTDGAALAGIHDGSDVHEYIDPVPPHGSTSFPVGTKIVKEATGGTTAHPIFAMVKRGGGFNGEAPGWEWFDLQNLDDGTDGVRIVWRGVAPPPGETYGADANAGCNACHVACGNDAVCAKELSLSQL